MCYKKRTVLSVTHNTKWQSNHLLDHQKISADFIGRKEGTFLSCPVKSTDLNGNDSEKNLCRELSPILTVIESKMLDWELPLPLTPSLLVQHRFLAQSFQKPIDASRLFCHL